MSKTMKEVKVVVVGSPSVGKSTLVLHIFRGDHDPTVNDDYRKQIFIDDEAYLLEILDAQSQIEWQQMRDLWYRRADAFVVCFDPRKRSTLTDAVEYVERILNVKGTEYIKWVLVATKCDLASECVVSREEAVAFAQKYHAASYIETSAKLGQNVTEVFVNATKASFLNKITSIKGHMKSLSIYQKVLPWNWSKFYKWDKELKRLSSSQVGQSFPLYSSHKTLKVSEDDFNDFYSEMPPTELIPSNVFDDLIKIFNSQESCWDVVFRVEDKQIYCHKIILALRSLYFKNLFDEKQEHRETIVIQKVPFIYMHEILRCCYDASVTLSKTEQLIELLKYNEEYRVNMLKEIVNKKIQKLQQQTNKNSNSSQLGMSLLSSEAIQIEMLPGLKDFLKLSDVTFSVDNKEFQLHKAIIMSRCKYFDAMLSHNFKEKGSEVIPINSMSATVFHTVVEYIYTGRIERLTPDICIEVLVASNLLGLKRLTQICEKTLQPLLDIDNVLAICQAAEYHNAHQLTNVCVYVIAREFPKVEKNPELNNLSESTLTKIKQARTKYEQEYTQWKQRKELEAKFPIMLFEPNTK